jgi:hypothetical protein
MGKAIAVAAGILFSPLVYARSEPQQTLFLIKVALQNMKLASIQTTEATYDFF